MNQFVLISGCSGGGKSTLLGELARRGYKTVAEPGTRIVREELLGEGSALPWVDGIAFARRAIDVAIADRAMVERFVGWVFFDRGLVDAACALEHLTGEMTPGSLCWIHRYHRQVFLAPPWPEIYINDRERGHSFDAANAEYQRLLKAYPALDYEVVLLPKASVIDRANYLLAMLIEEQRC